MSIVRLTDAEVRERYMKPIDDRQEIWDLCIEVTNNSFYTAGAYSIDGGVQILVTNLSGQPVINENCPLPQDNDDEFIIASKKKFIRIIKDRMRKLVRDEPRGAA